MPPALAARVLRCLEFSANVERAKSSRQSSRTATSGRVTFWETAAFTRGSTVLIILRTSFRASAFPCSSWSSLGSSSCALLPVEVCAIKHHTTMINSSCVFNTMTSFAKICWCLIDLGVAISEFRARAIMSWPPFKFSVAFRVNCRTAAADPTAANHSVLSPAFLRSSLGSIRASIVSSCLASASNKASPLAALMAGPQAKQAASCSSVRILTHCSSVAFLASSDDGNCPVLHASCQSSLIPYQLVSSAAKRSNKRCSAEPCSHAASKNLSARASGGPSMPGPSPAMPLTASGCSAHRPPCPRTPKASASPTTQATHASP